MDYSRVTPRSRNGTTGISYEGNIGAGKCIWCSPPDRIAAVSVFVNIPTGASATFAIEVTGNLVDNLGSDGNGSNGATVYWSPVERDSATYTSSRVKMIANSVTGIRVRCIAFNAGKSGATGINVCFVG